MASLRRSSSTAPPGDDRLFVVEQDGHIQVLRDGVRLGAFLDLSSLVSSGGERGLLGLAFSPSYPADPRFYVDYTDLQGDTVVAEYRVSADPDRADPASARVLLTVDQPYRNHNGGMVAFGPDGYLYIGMGDGGSAGDPERNGQDPASRLGSILRISVDGDPYTVPPNPWASEGGAAEVWAKGLRNPWRFSFDGDLLYIGDVGQDAWEEIDIAHIDSWRLNFGWSVMEGTHCYRAGGVQHHRPGAARPGVRPRRRRLLRHRRLRLPRRGPPRTGRRLLLRRLLLRPRSPRSAGTSKGSTTCGTGPTPWAPSLS